MMLQAHQVGSGEYGKLCYRTACQKPDAVYYNVKTERYYCKRCADVINLQAAAKGFLPVCVAETPTKFEIELDLGTDDEQAEPRV